MKSVKKNNIKKNDFFLYLIIKKFIYFKWSNIYIKNLKENAGEKKKERKNEIKEK